MRTIKIRGGSSLSGAVRASGSKNAALPILFATVITRGISVIRNVPDISDTRVTVSILESLGATVSRLGDALTVDTRSLQYCDPPSHLVSSIRASTYLLGASLSRFGVCRICGVGGCGFSYRPIDMHVYACCALGGVVDGEYIRAPSLSGGEICFSKKSVGATVNSIILAAAANGKTVIRGHALEPHIKALADYLISAGASISISDDEITVEGRELHGGAVTVIGDMIEAGSYLAAGLITGGEVTVTGCDPSHLYSFNRALALLGATVISDQASVTVRGNGAFLRTAVTAAPYPDFPTDLQPIIAPLMAYGAGGEIRDTVWTTRYGYLASLLPFGFVYQMRGDTAVIAGVHLHSGETEATDLRGGMSAVLCALSASGESAIHGAEHIMRGYERLDCKLNSLGASVIIE